MSCMGVHIARSDAIGITARRLEGISVSVGVVCSVEQSVYLTFTPDGLLWLNPELGVTKNSLLKASGNWELKEVEELL